MGVLLGIDIGSSRTKGVLVTHGGAIVASAARDHQVSFPRPGWAEHDGEEIWWNEFADIARELTSGTDERVDAVCVDAIGPSLLPADGDGNALRPGILYGIDSRATAEIDELNDRYGAENIISECGSLLTSQSVGPKVLWIRNHEPEIWARTRHIFMAHTFVVHRLTGAYVLDHHSASTCAPMYDYRAMRWDPERSRDIVQDRTLPDLLWPSDVAGRVTREGATRSGIRKGTPVAVGTLDAWMDAISVGVREPGDRLLDYGTTMVVIGILARPVADPRLSATIGVFPGTHAIAAGTAASGALSTWFQKVAGREVPLASLLAEAALVPAGSDGLVVLPYFAGERAPMSDPSARGVIMGLTLRHDRGHIYRALLEATAFSVRHILETLRDVGQVWGGLKAVGAGGSRGLWTQIVADVTGEPQLLSRHGLGACYGSAWLAGVAVGAVDRGSTWNEVVGSVEPDPTHRGIYDKLYGVYRDLYPTTAPLMHELAALGNAGGPRPSDGPHD